MWPIFRENKESAGILKSPDVRISKDFKETIPKLFKEVRETMLKELKKHGDNDSCITGSQLKSSDYGTK